MDDVPFPRTGAPALRALASAGYTHLGQLDGIPMRSVLAWHGMGPKAVGVLRRAMAEHGWAFADDDPRAGAAAGGRAQVSTGAQPDRNANSDLRARDGSAREWIAGLPTARQRDQGSRLLQIFTEVTGVEPRMWGPSIVGFGELHYVYESGREGDMPRVAFSPRARALTLYGVVEAPDASPLLERLGPHRRSVGCLYVTTLDKVDEGVLRRLVGLGWDHADRA